MVTYSLTCANTNSSANAIAVTQQYAYAFANSNPYTGANCDTDSYISANRSRRRICASPTSIHHDTHTNAEPFAHTNG